MRDVLVAPLWLGVTALLASACWRLGRRWHPEDGPLQRVVHAGLLAWACLVAAATLLGCLGALTAGLLLAVVAACGAVLWHLSAPTGPPPPPPRQTPLPWLLVWAATAAMWAGHVLTSGLLTFPNHWDVMGYHLCLVDHWLQARSLYAPACSHWSSPGNGELLCLWMVAPFSGDFLAGSTNVLPAVLLALGTVELAGTLGVSEAFRHLAALAVTACFVVLAQLVNVENDLAVSALFVCCLAYGARYAATARPADLAFAALALGLLAGVKFYALGYAVVAWTVLVVRVAAARGWRPAAGVLAVGLMGTGLAAYWYARNALVTGSPLFPAGGWKAEQDFQSVGAPAWGTTFLGSGRPQVLLLGLEAVRKLAGPCQLLAVLGLPVTLGWLLVTGLRAGTAGGRGEGAGWLALATLVVVAGLVLAVTPFAIEVIPGTLDQLKGERTPVRYGLCFLTLAVLALAVLLDDLGRLLGRPTPPWRSALGRLPAVAFGGVLGYHLARALVLPHPGLGPEVFRGFHVETSTSALLGLLLLLGCSNLALAWAFLRPSPRARLALFVAAATILPAWAVASLAERWHQGFVPYYNRLFRCSTFSLLAGQPEGVVVCVIDDRPYPFFGSRRQARACRPLNLASPAALRRYLRLHGATLLVVHNPASPFPTHVKCVHLVHEEASGNPAMFVPLEQGPSFSVFEVASDTPSQRDK